MRILTLIHLAVDRGEQRKVVLAKLRGLLLWHEDVLLLQRLVRVVLVDLSRLTSQALLDEAVAVGHPKELLLIFNHLLIYFYFDSN